MSDPAARELADEIAKLSRRLQRERKTRLDAEQIAETGLRKLYEKQQQLQVLTRELSEALEQQTAIAEVLQIISSSPGDLEPVSRAMLANATRLCEASYSAMWLKDGDHFRNAGFHGPLPAAYTELWRNAKVSPTAHLGRVARSRSPLQVADMRRDQTCLDGHPLSATGVDVAGIRTMALVPMLKEDEFVGVIAIYRTEVRPFTDKQIKLVQNFASQVVIAIENTRLLERTRADEELRESKARLERAQRLAHVGWWERDFSAARVALSDEVCRIFGLQPGDWPEWHAHWLKLIHPEDRARVVEAAEAAVGGGPRYDVEYRVVRPDGAVPIVHSQGDVTWDAAGRPLRQFGVLQDITELRQTEHQLRESEERFRTLVQFSFDVYWESDAQHRFTRQEFSKGLADAPAQGSEIGKTRWEVPYLEPDAEAWRKHRETLDAHLPFRDFELARPTPEGGKRYVSVSGLPVFDKSGRFIGYRGVGRHITDRKRAEEALRRSEAYLAATQRQSHTGTWVYNGTGTVYWSEECYRIWGLDPQQGLPSRETISARIHPDDRARVSEAFQELVGQR